MLVGAIPRISHKFFWNSMMSSAPLSFFCVRSSSRRSISTSGRSGFFVGFRPCLSSVSATSAPCRYSLRHFARLEEYSPSHRSSAPTSPGFLHASAARAIRALYAAENRLRPLVADTSGSGAFTDVGLLDASNLFESIPCLLSLYTNYTREAVSYI